MAKWPCPSELIPLRKESRELQRISSEAPRVGVPASGKTPGEEFSQGEKEEEEEERT